MKRPLATAGFSYLLALVAAAAFGLNFSIGCSALFAIFTFFSFRNEDLRRKLVIPVALTSMTAAFIVFSIYTYYFVQPVSLLYGHEAYVYGRVTQEPYFQYDKYYTVLDVENVDIENSVQHFKMRVSLNSIDDVEVSDDLYLRVKFTKIPDRTIEYRFAKGVLIYGYQLSDNDLQIYKQSNPIIRGVYSFRRRLTQVIKENFPTELSQELIACLTGDNINMDIQLKNRFRRTGLSHLLAVSGLHLSIISFAVLYILRHLRIKKKISCAVTSVIILMFMMMTGFSPSVVRAGIMTIVVLIGKIIDREADSVNSLGLVCFVMCIFNPYAAVDVGFMLSLSATLGLVVLTPKLREYFRKRLEQVENVHLKTVLEYASDSFAVSIAALIPTLPITIIFFKEISLISPISNLLVIQLFSFFMIFGGISAMIGIVDFLVFLSKPFELIALIFGKIVNFIIAVLSDISFAAVKLPYTFVSIWICATIVLAAMVLYLRKNNELLKKAMLFSALIFAAGAVSYMVFNVGVLTVNLVDSDGASPIIINKNNNCIIIGCGGEPYDLTAINDIAADEVLGECKAIILPSLEKDNVSNFTSIIRLFDTQSIYCASDGSFYDEIQRRFDAQSIIPIENSEFSPFRGLNIKIMTDQDNKNWVIADYQKMRMLFCPFGADVSNLPEEYRRAELVFIFSPDISNISMFNGSMYVVCANELNAAKIKLTLLSNKKENIIMTGGEGNLQLKTRGGRNLTVGRI